MTIDDRLLSNSSYIHDLDLCQIRLNHNAAFPWVLLIPHEKIAVEMIDLSPTDLGLLIQEIALTSSVLKKAFRPDKLNVASLGNIVPQLHVHVIARFKVDGAWPNPVWNSGIEKDYSEQEKNDTINSLREFFTKINKE